MVRSLSVNIEIARNDVMMYYAFDWQLNVKVGMKQKNLWYISISLYIYIYMLSMFWKCNMKDASYTCENSTEKPYEEKMWQNPLSP